MKITRVLVLSLLVLPMVAGVAFAQSPGQFPGAGDIGIDQYGPQNVTTWVEVVITVVQWFYTIVFVVAVLFILLAAYNFITSGGDEEKTGTAKKQLMYAVIGVAVALLSYGIVTFVRNTVIDSGSGGF